MANHWRDWANQPDLVTAMWPKLVASHAAPATLLALLGVSPSIRRIVLREAPQAKLTLAVSATMPSVLPLLQLERTKPTTLALMGPEPVVIVVPASGSPPTSHPNDDEEEEEEEDEEEEEEEEEEEYATRKELAEQMSSFVCVHTGSDNPCDESSEFTEEEEEREHRLQATTNTHHLLLSLPTCRLITRLVLRGVTATTQLLEAVQGLPCLNHLQLINTKMPPAPYEYLAASLPQGLRRLHLELDEGDDQTGTYAGLVAEFMSLDTITDMTITTLNEDRVDMDDEEDGHVSIMLQGLTRRGLRTHALRKLNAPFFSLYEEALLDLLTVAPGLEELEVHKVDIWQNPELTAKREMSLRVLRVHELELSGLLGLPLGGTQDLELHVLEEMRAHSFDGEDDEPPEDGAEDDEVEWSIQHLTTPAAGKRQVVLFGLAGGDGSTYVWNDNLDICTMPLSGILRVLQLCQVPPRRLDIQDRKFLDVDGLVLALGPLQSITQLRLSTPLLLSTLQGKGWWSQDADMLLARLPLHVERVCLDPHNDDSAEYRKARDYPDVKAADELFKCMVSRASQVPERQARPLRLCIAGVGPRGKPWGAVELTRMCRDQGHMGVIIEEVWE